MTSGGLAVVGARGATTTLFVQGAKIAVQTVSLIALSRVLPPADFGVAAIMVAIVGLSELVRDFGISSAAIAVPNLNTAQASTIFWLNCLIGAVLAFIIIGAANEIAMLFGQPSMSTVIPYAAVAIVANSIGAQFLVMLARELKFFWAAAIELFAQAIAVVVAVSMALAHLGLGALIGLQLTAAVTSMVGRIVASSWYPRLVFSPRSIKHLWLFGFKLFLAQSLTFAASNTDNLVIARRMSAAALGYYTRAFQFLSIPVQQLLAPLTNVALPILARARQRDAFGPYVRAALRCIAYSFGCGLGLAAALAPDAIPLVLGQGWSPSVQIFQTLAVAGMFQCLAHVSYWVFLSANAPGSLLRYNLVTKPVTIMAVVVGSHWGILGVALAYSLALALAWPVSVFALPAIGGLRRAEVLCEGAKVVLLVSLACVATLSTQYVLGEVAPALGLLVGGVTYLGVLILLVITIRPYREDAKWLMKLGLRVVRSSRGNLS